MDDVSIIAESTSYAENVRVLEKALGRCDKWAQRHAVRFAPDKFELIHFRNPREADGEDDEDDGQPVLNSDIWEVPVEPWGNDRMAIKIPGQDTARQEIEIQPKESARYLGVWLDKHLDFKTHRKKLLGKAAGSLEALRAISGSTWGASLLVMRKVYQAMVIPQMFWGITAWYSPASRAIPAVELKRVTNEFVKIQKRAAILISRAFKSISAAALDIELYLVPIRLQMQQMIEEAAIRIQTGPQWARLAGLQSRRNPQETKRGGLSPLEALKWRKGSPLAPTRKEQEEQWESRKAFVIAPWEPRIQGIIEERESALRTHDKICQGAEAAPTSAPPPQVIYTDGSGIEGQVGASAVRPGKGQVARRFLGTEAEATVYTAELNGIEMALEMARPELNSAGTMPKIEIFADSRAAIQAVRNPARPSGQYLVESIYDRVRVLRGRAVALSIKVRWIPAHIGVPGNEAADKAAKEAALGGGGAEAGPKMFRLASSAKRATRKRIMGRWAKQWERERTASSTRRLVKAPDKKILRLYDGLSKPYTSILIQLRSMRIGLKHFLYKINASESDRCGCDEGSQTPQHVLLQCPLYTDLRKKILDRIAARTDLGTTTDYDEIISHPQAVRYIALFMHQTGLLGQFRYVEMEPDPDQEQIGLTAMA